MSQPTLGLIAPHLFLKWPGSKLVPDDSPTSCNPGPTLETLSPDVILEILGSLSNFRELYTLIRSSPVCLRLFDTYRISIWTKIAQNIVGIDAWEAVTTILLYQRNYEKAPEAQLFRGGTFGTRLQWSPLETRIRVPPREIEKIYAAVKKGLETGFVLCRGDIHRILSNQRFFNVVARDLKAKAGAPRKNWELPYTLTVSFHPTLFYQTWQMGLQLEHESITMLARRKDWTKERHINLCRVSYAVSRSTYWICQKFLPRPVIFGLCGSHQNMVICMDKKNPCLLSKMVCYLNETSNLETSQWDEFEDAFLEDYSKMSVEESIAKYDLDNDRG